MIISIINVDVLANVMINVDVLANVMFFCVIACEENSFTAYIRQLTVLAQLSVLFDVIPNNQGK